MSALVPLPIRSDLHLKKQKQQDEVFYIVKDTENDGYFRFEESQIEMIRLFDGKLNISELVEKFNQLFKQVDYDTESLESLYDDLKTHKLLQRSKREQNIALVERLKDQKRSKFLQAKGSVLLIRFHLLDPNAYFDKVIDSIRFLWHPTTVKSIFTLMFVAFCLVCMDGKQFLMDFDRVYFSMYDNPLNFLMVWVIVLAVIAFHECGHGLTCKYYGGDVHDMGFLLLVMQPCLYCNVNDAWLFESKRQKILVALAGVYTELVLGMVAAFVWLVFDVGGIVGTIAFVVMTMCTAQSLLFNLNPLVKFDGYYILADYLEIINLKQNASSWFSWVLKTRGLGLQLDPPFHATPREKRIYFYYGLLSTVYITLMLTTIATLGFSLVADNFGFVGILAYLWMVAKLVAKLTNTWPRVLKDWLGEKLFGGNRRRWTFGVLAAFVLTSLVWQPQIQIASNCKVQNHKKVIRAPESGFVSYVGYGENRFPLVENGAIVQLQSPQLSQSLEDQQSRLRSLQFELQRVKAQRTSTEYGRLNQEVSLLQAQIRSTRTRRDHLTIYLPPGSWKVQGMPPALMEGRFYAKGSELVTLVPAVMQEFIAEVDQSDLTFIAEGDEARVMLTDGAYYSGTVDYIPPLAIVDGTERRFEARIRVRNVNSIQIPEELLCSSIISGKSLPLWRHIWRPVKKLFRADRFF